MKMFPLVFLLAVSACTTNSYIREDGTEVTVKKFAGIPYLEEDVTTEVVPMGSAGNPI